MPFRKLLLALPFVFLLSPLRAQNGNTELGIEGPQTVCAGACYTFLAFSQFINLDPNGDFLWYVFDSSTPTGAPVSSQITVGPLASICFDTAGVYTVVVRYIPEGSIDLAYEGTLSVFVAEIEIPELLFSDAPPCPNDHLTDPPTPDTIQCERLCAQTTVTYTFSKPIQSPGNGVIFQEYQATNVSDIQINGNQVTITWANPGIGTFTAYYFSQTAGGSQGYCADNVSLCVEVLPQPVASFTSSPAAQSDTIRICLGEDIQFNNTSTNTNGYFWSFGDFTTSTLSSPLHTYAQAGVYEVYMVAESGCTCTDTAKVFVLVENTNKPPISCAGAVCPGATVTYSTDAGCGNYNWVVSSNGTIVTGGGPNENYITVTWNSGYIGTITLDVSGCPNAAPCVKPTTIEVPIVSDEAQIEGPAKVCPGSTVRYSLPEYNGASITWAVSSLGTIVEGQGTNEISVSWPGSAPSNQQQWVAVSFDHCYLGCSGADTLAVDIKSPFRLTGPVEVCPNQNGQYFARSSTNNNPVPAVWQVLNDQGQSVWSFAGPDDDANVSWAVVPGSYEVIAYPATPGDYCTDSAFLKVEVPNAPPAVDSIAGARFICTGSPYTYEALSTYPGGTFNWSVFIGGFPSPRTGQRINVTWFSPNNNSLSVIQISPQGCASPPVSVNIQVAPAPTISGDASVCIEALGTYATPPIPQAEYEWTILPSGAGTIIGDPTLSTIQVLWHSAGANTVRLKICNQTTNFPVTINPKPTPSVTHPASLCNTATAMVQTTQPFAAYLWRDADGDVVSNIATPNLGPGYFQAIVEDANGCTGDALFEIKNYPGPIVNISTPNSRCLDIGIPTIYTLANQAGAMYEWYLDGASLGVFTPSLVATQAGSYTVDITDVNGCTATSNILQVFATCVGGGGGSGFPGGLSGCDPAIADPFAINPAAPCNVRSYQITDADFIAGTAAWNFDDPLSGANNTSMIDGPTHTYTVAGFHEVTLSATYNDGAGGTVSCGIFRVDTIAVAADFLADPTCPGAPVDFNDRSTSLSITSIVDWAWDFGDPASGAANNSALTNPTHIYNTPGAYIVTLTITAASGCQSSISKQVDVLPPPVISFDEPVQRCEDQALAFEAIGPANLANVSWDFGDAGSGDANFSSLAQTFHTFDVDFGYAVTLSATDITGCSNTFDRIVNVVANNLAGNIAVAPGNQICEGDTATLTSPLGGVSWLWSTQDSVAAIAVGEEGVYKVTLTDAFGCQYIPNQVAVQVIPAPSATIRAIDKDEFGQPIAYTYDSLQVCFGEDVFLEALSQGLSYTYQWSNGQSGQAIEFSENRGNLLPIGTHQITSTVTDALTGCDRVVGPFVIVVNPNPLAVQISSSPGGILCESTPITFSVNTPEPGVNFFWNTGQSGASIVNSLAGDYFTTAINSFGCSSRSDTLTVLRGPNIKNVPSGCFTRCRPDTICVAPIIGAASYQWLFNGTAIPGPEGTQLNLIPDQSGTYTLEVTDFIGCTLTSAEVNLELFDGYGPISGSIFVDVNDNGTIDAADTLYSGVAAIQINGVTAALDTLLNSSNGSYILINAPADNYSLQIDTASLPGNFIPVFIQVDSSLVGCNDSLQVNWLLRSCQPVNSSTSINICEGETITYNGFTYATDTTFTAVFQSLTGCDSLDMVNIQTLPVSFSSLPFQTCPGTPVIYNGMPIDAGQQMDFVFTNNFGCDSTVTVVVSALATSASNLTLSTCPGTPVIYNGTPLSVGQQMDFVFTNQLGCDSIVTVMVTSLGTSTSSLTLSTCPGTPVNYNGTLLNAGQQMDFMFFNQFGCDSTVTVLVTALATSTGTETLQACTGTSVMYNGTPLSPGSVTPFTLSNSVGCDSVVTVTVVEVFPSAANLNLSTCPGESISYNGSLLNPGTQTDFVFFNQFGCDSVVTVIVTALPIDTTAIALDACEGTSISYNGLTLNAGETVSVVLLDAQGCDSVVVVKVNSIPNPNLSVTTMASCPNTGTGSLGAFNTSGGLAPYQYSIDGVNYQASPDFPGLSAGNYTAIAQDANGCMGQATATVVALEPLVLNAQEFLLPCQDLQVSISTEVLSGLDGTLTYLWDNGESTPTRLVTAPGVYTVQVSNNCETLSQAVSVQPEVQGKVGVFYIPNSFSPNKDGINDFFQVFTGIGVQVEKFQLLVFDRWGNQFFATEDYSSGWDGAFRGKDMDPGVYVWYINATVLRCGQVMHYEDKGDVAIVR